MHGVEHGRGPLPRGRGAGLDRRHRRSVRRHGAAGLDAIHCSPVAVGSGTVATSHGQLSVPPPAVVELLRGIPTYAGPAVAELCTPTGAALLAHWATSWGPQPPMLVDRVGTGRRRPRLLHPSQRRPHPRRPAGDTVRPACARCPAGHRDRARDERRRPRPTPVATDPAAPPRRRCLRCLAHPDPDEEGPPCPHAVGARRARAGGRGTRGDLRRDLGDRAARNCDVDKHALDREFTQVDVHGQRIAIKVARSGATVVNVQPEFEDVAAAAAALGWSVKSVLAAATAAAWKQWDRG